MNLISWSVCSSSKRGGCLYFSQLEVFYCREHENLQITHHPIIMKVSKCFSIWLWNPLISSKLKKNTSKNKKMGFNSPFKPLVLYTISGNVYYIYSSIALKQIIMHRIVPVLSRIDKPCIVSYYRQLYKKIFLNQKCITNLVGYQPLGAN